MPMTSNLHSDTTTDGIRIQAAAMYLPQESGPNNPHVFGYQITMTNVGAPTSRLLLRHWIIVDSNGHREEVRREGVVGEYPRLAPGESFSYVSYCPIATPWGTMEGSYTFERLDGTRFEVMVGRFFLVPNAPALPLESQARS
jgi:ApaG protein